MLGLRINEALVLDTDDLDADNGAMTIRCGKLGKARLVPLQASVVIRLTMYITQRDRMLQSGLRASELVNLRREDIVLGTGAHIHCEGKGRKQRSTPLRRDTAKLLEKWKKDQPGTTSAPLFPSIRGEKMSPDALEHLVRKHCVTASASCGTLIGKRISLHVLRHSTAMELLQHGVDQSVIALWLGHKSVETTQVYIHADLRLKEQALARLAVTPALSGRYRPDDKLLAFLEAL